MRRAVVDTNVVVAGLLSPHGPPGRIVEWLRQGAMQAVCDDRILGEYRDVLTRPVFGLPQAEVMLVLAAIEAQAWRVEVCPADAVHGLPDPEDAPFLECARVGQCCLVMGNLRHFPRRVTRGIRVVTPAQFVRELPSG